MYKIWKYTCLSMYYICVVPFLRREGKRSYCLKCCRRQKEKGNVNVTTRYCMFTLRIFYWINKWETTPILRGSFYYFFFGFSFSFIIGYYHSSMRPVFVYECIRGYLDLVAISSRSRAQASSPLVSPHIIPSLSRRTIKDSSPDHRLFSFISKKDQNHTIQRDS